MKRWKIILPTLLATNSLPLVGLVGCNNSQKVHVYFNNGDSVHGKLEGNLDIEIKKGTRWCDLFFPRVAPVPEGLYDYTFAGWFFQGTQPLSEDNPTPIDSNWSVTAQFTAPTQPKLHDGSTVLVGQSNKPGFDKKVWRLWYGDETITPEKYELVGVPEDLKGKININIAGEISWESGISEGSHAPFKVRAIYGGNQYESEEPIYLHIGPETNMFTSDSWDTVCWWANAGLDALHTAYAEDCKANKFEPGTLIGLERKVTVNGLEHKVLVVDENADTYSNDGVTTPAALTFQFQNLISAGESSSSNGPLAKSGLRINWGPEGSGQGSGAYWESILHHALNGTDSVPVLWKDIMDTPVEAKEDQISVYQMIQREDTNGNLANQIKQVKRAVCTYDSRDGHNNPLWKTTYGTMRLFLPTISNYFSIWGIMTTHEEVITLEKKALCLTEGQTDGILKQYAYYAHGEKIGNNPISNEEIFKPTFKFACLKDVAGSGDRTLGSWFYWLGSPYIQTDSQVANVSPNGCFCNYGAAKDYNCIAPCFCI